MSFFHPFYQEEASFTPLFRLLDDFDSYNRQTGGQGAARQGRIRSFTPRFDMRETEGSFELHGELPGIDKDHISIDFTDPQTIVIKGKVERSYEAGTPPAGYVTGPAMSGAITEGGEEKPHKATVEDVGEDGGEAAPAEEQQVAKKSGAPEKKKQDRSKYWYSERSVGEFSRTFGFPCLVDQENVSASLKDGILNVSIPKAKKPAARRIAIN